MKVQKMVGYSAINKINMRKKVNRIYKSTLAVLLAVVMLMLSVPINSQAITAKTSQATTTHAAAAKTSVIVSTQAQLTAALADKNIQTITIKTSRALEITVPNMSYKTKTLVINSPKATIMNNGTFKKLIVTDAKTITENAKGNTYTVNDKKVTIKIAKSAEVKTITFGKKNANCIIVANGDINQIVLIKKSIIALTGNNTDNISVEIKTAAKGSVITSAVPVDVTATTDVSITLKKGAEKSTVTSTEKTPNLVVENKTTKSIKITTPDGKKTLAAGETMSSRNKPTEAPENSEASQPEPTKAPVTPTPGVTSIPSSGETSITTYYTVTFDSVGGTSIASVQVVDGNTITNLPTPQKDKNIFLGWYTDSGYLNEFSGNTVVNSNLTLYAKYALAEQYKSDFFTLTEQQAGLSFTVLSTDPAMTADSVKSAITLDIADNSKAVELTITGGNGNFTIGTQSGFTEAAAYTLTLSDSRLSFMNQESIIRKCTFTIAKAEVNNVELNDSIIYIPQSDLSNIKKNGTKVDSLSVSVVGLSENSDTSAEGTFTYNNNTVLNTGDVLCIYSGEKPNASADENKYLEDDIAYVKVTDVSGSIGSQIVSYSNTEGEDVISLPDILPIAVGEGNDLIEYTAATENTLGTFTEAATDLDFSSYSDMGLSKDTTIDEGDYLAFYTGSVNDMSNTTPIVYGKVEGVTEQDDKVIVTYAASTEEEMQESLEYYSKKDIDSDTLLEGVDVAAAEKIIEQQVLESGFAEASAEYLTKLAMETDGFKELAGDDYDLMSFSVKTNDGVDADMNVIKSMAVDPSGVYIKNLRVTPKIEAGMQKLKGCGLRCTVNVSFDVDLIDAKNNKITISFSANFAQEITISLGVAGEIVWSGWWIFKYPSDYLMSSSIDIWDYTSININATVYTTKGSFNITNQIQKIINAIDPKEKADGVQTIYEMYSNMMKYRTDWIKIFSQNIVTFDYHALLGIFEIRLSVDFVISADINAALSCQYEYLGGRRYGFWAALGSRDAGSNNLTLHDEIIGFKFYTMGKVGIRAGCKVVFAIGVGSVDTNSLGFTAEVGIYAKLYGYYYLQIGYGLWTAAGPYCLELGFYLDLSFNAQILNGKYQYNAALYSNEWPFISWGERYKLYDLAYAKPTKTITIKDVKAYSLPDSTFGMIYMDLKEGTTSTKIYNPSDFYIQFTNKNFSIEGRTIKINVPTGTHKMECDMLITWRHSYMDFTNAPIMRTFHFAWDDLNDDGYTISCDSTGGSAVSNITQLYGTSVTAPTAPVKAGYTFGGWYNDEKLTNKYTFSTMPANNTLLFAKWTANKNTEYKVEYYLQNLENDDYTLTSADILTGTTATAVSATVKTYEGFTYNSSYTGSVTSGNISADGSLVLSLYYSRNNYTLTYKPDNGSSNIVKTMRYGAVVTVPTVIRTGYSFNGWDTAIGDTMPAANMTYTAQWMINSYSIEFNTNGGNKIDKITQAYGSTVASPMIPERKGYTFLGWYRDSSFTKPYTLSTISAENITLFAKWNANTDTGYKVQHYQQNLSGDGYTLYETEKCYGTSDTAVTAVAKTYTGFICNSSAENTVKSGIVVVEGSLILKLYYIRTISSIYFITNGGSKVADIVQRYGTAVSLSKNPTRKGYSFEGWYSDQTLNNAYTLSTMPNMDITLFAKYKPDNDTAYQVQYYCKNLEDTKYMLTATDNLTGTSDTTANAVVKKIEGFACNSSVSGTVNSGTITVDGSLILKLYYDRMINTISFVSNDGSKINAITQKYESAVSEPKKPTRVGYCFGGWYSNETLKDSYTFSTMPAENISLYAKWNPNTDTPYKVEHYIENPYGPGWMLRATDELTGTSGTTITAVPKDGYLASSHIISEGTVSSGFVAGDGSLVLKLYYENNTYTISFNSSGGSSVEPISFKCGYQAKVPEPQKPTRQGYYFGGWYASEALDDMMFNFSALPYGDITLYAKWNPNIDEYKVEHYKQTETGDYVLDITETINKTAGTLVIAEPKIYTGFSCNSGVNGTVSSGTVAGDGSLTLKLYYDRNIYTISFVSNGGSQVASISQRYGLHVTKPQDPTRAGFVFADWYGSDLNSVPFSFFSSTMPAENITLYAKWNWDGERKEFQLWVGGIQVTTDNMNSIWPGDLGVITYEPTTNVLTLNNATITSAYNGDGYQSGIYDKQNSLLTINVIGSNTINLAGLSKESTSCGIVKSSSNIIIQGDSTASLTITGNDSNNLSAGIYTLFSNLTVTGGVTVTALGGSSTISAGIYQNNSTGNGGYTSDMVLVTNGSLLKLFAGKVNGTYSNSSGYIIKTGFGSMMIYNGGQIIAYGVYAPIDDYAGLVGASQIWVGEKPDGSDAVLYTGGLEYCWNKDLKYKYICAVSAASD